MQISATQIKAFRESRGWSQAKLARQIGCTQPTIWRIENGEKFGGVIEKALERLIVDFDAKGEKAATP